MPISAREIGASRLAGSPPDLFHRATPLSGLTPGPEALRPSIAAGLPLFGCIVLTVLYATVFSIGRTMSKIEMVFLAAGRRARRVHTGRGVEALMTEVWARRGRWRGRSGAPGGAQPGWGRQKAVCISYPSVATLKISTLVSRHLRRLRSLAPTSNQLCGR